MLESLALNILGAIMSGVAGLALSWLTRRSVNYRKIDKQIIVSILLYFIYLQAVLFVSSIVGTTFMLLFSIEGVTVVLSMATIIIITILFFYGVILKTKRMKALMCRFRTEGKVFFLLIHGYIIFNVLVSFIYLPYALAHVLTEEKSIIVSILEYASWFITIWWFFMIVAFIWRTANYVFSEMKITLVDGEVIQYNCSPQMCRVHKNYLRLIKRDEKGVIIYERHIHELTIKQIEYLS